MYFALISYPLCPCAVAPVTPGDESMTVIVGEELSLSVTITDFNLPITVTWRQDGDELMSGVDRVTITTESLDTPPAMSTMVRNPVVSLVDAGVYTVTATNPAGDSVTTFTVTVTGK